MNATNNLKRLSFQNALFCSGFFLIFSRSHVGFKITCRSSILDDRYDIGYILVTGGLLVTA